MKGIKISLASLLTLFIFSGWSAQASAEAGECRIGATEYESLSEAVAQVNAGKAEGEIELAADCVLDVGGIGASVTIRGNGHSVSVPTQSKTEDGRLDINSTLTFKDTVVRFSNGRSWSVVMGSGGVLKLLDGSDCSFSVCGIYTAPGAQIIVDSSKMSLENMQYTSMMAEAYGQLTVQNGSEFIIEKPMEINGITGFNIVADASHFVVSGCRRQGLVKCSLKLTNGAKADISGNSYGMNMYSGNTLTVDKGASLSMNENSVCALLMQGRSTANIQPEGSFECRLNGSGWSGGQRDEAYGSKAAVNIGWYSASYVYTTGSFNAAQGASVKISDNYCRAISNYGTVKLGSGTEIMGNGALAEGETDDKRRIERGGGVQNEGIMLIDSGAKLYNNHASAAADDVYNGEKGVLTLPETGTDWTLDDCGDEIDGWYTDREKQRWSAHSEPFFAEKNTGGQYIGATELKAAHKLKEAPQTGDGFFTLYLSVMGVSGLTAAALVLKLKEKGRRD